MADKRGAPRAVRGDWQVNGILTLQGGQPFTPVLGIDNSNTGQLQDRPNLVGDPYAAGGTCTETRTADCWVNPAAFAQPAPFTFGNAGRNSLRGPGYQERGPVLVKNAQHGRRRGSCSSASRVFNLLNRSTTTSRTARR